MALSKPLHDVLNRGSDSDFEEPLNKRFRELSDAQLSELQDDLNPKNTVKSDAKCERILVAYLRKTKLNENFCTYDNGELDKTLGKFWFAARNQKGNYYTV